MQNLSNRYNAMQRYATGGPSTWRTDDSRTEWTCTGSLDGLPLFGCLCWSVLPGSCLLGVRSCRLGPDLLNLSGLSTPSRKSYLSPWTAWRGGRRSCWPCLLHVCTPKFLVWPARPPHKQLWYIPKNLRNSFRAAVVKRVHPLPVNHL